MSAAACGGDGAPAVFCGDFGEVRECLWFAGGCPAAEFGTPCAAGGGEDCKETMFGGFGREPWTVDGRATVGLVVNPAIDARQGPVVDCAACAVTEGATPPEGWEVGRCLAREGLCGMLLEPLRVIRPSVGNGNWGWPSWVPLLVAHPGIGGGPALLIELDPAAGLGRARVCVVWTSDTGRTELSPVCATSGRLEVNALPASADDIPDVHGVLDVEFSDFSPFPELPPFVHGLQIHAEF
jgi:hypothetical protein